MTEEKDCTGCDRRYQLTRIKVGMRDKDSYICSCGTTVIEWNGGVIYQVSEIKRPDSLR